MLRDYAHAAIGECPIPKSWRQAKSSPEWPQWEEAIEKEMTNVESHGVWEEVEPDGTERLINTMM